jgi:hypothetical protein
MLWVEHTAYVGPERRLRRSGLRLLERRQARSLSEHISLVAAVRHLRVRVGHADDHEGREAFCRRARAVALLANAYDQREVGDVLMDLVRQLESSLLQTDPRQEIFAELERLEPMLPRTALAS